MPGKASVLKTAVSTNSTTEPNSNMPTVRKGVQNELLRQLKIVADGLHLATRPNHIKECLYEQDSAREVRGSRPLS